MKFRNIVSLPLVGVLATAAPTLAGADPEALRIYTREPGVYGSTTLAEIEQRLAAQAIELGDSLTALQSNAEAMRESALGSDYVEAVRNSRLTQRLVAGTLPDFKPHRPERPSKSEGGVRFKIASPFEPKAR